MTKKFSEYTEEEREELEREYRRKKEEEHKYLTPAMKEWMLLPLEERERRVKRMLAEELEEFERVERRKPARIPAVPPPPVVPREPRPTVMPEPLAEAEKGELLRKPPKEVALPLEAWVGGTPPEVEAGPLYEEPIPHHPRPSELAEYIGRLRTDATELTQIKVEFEGGTAWVLPQPKYTLVFKRPEPEVVGEMMGARTYEELKDYYEFDVLPKAETEFPGWRVERRYRADENKHVFWAFPPERKTRRAEPRLLAREVIALEPTRLMVQHMKRYIYPPPGAELPEKWQLKPVK